MTELTKLYSEISACRRCPLAQGRTNTVPGEGAPDADVLFIGEAPGFHEDRSGRPFVGAAGRFLDQLLELAKLRRQDVYICNVVKCRPPNNREPQPNEIEACAGYLERQIQLVRPRLIVTLGRYSMAKFIPNASISKVHGIARMVNGITVLPFFHPAAALHQPKYRELIEQDFLKIPAILAEAGRTDPEPPGQQAQQLNLL